MKRNLLELVSNGKSIDLEATEFYAAILGAAPSKGARSPSLWNRAFNALGISAMMHPMDVTRDNLSALVDALRCDSRFRGGAVAVPYKQDIIRFLDDLEEEASAIGAVNCIYRRGDRLVGANSDGAASLMSIRSLLRDEGLSGARAIVLGLGGAGRAVAAYLAKALGPTGTLFLANRSPKCTAIAEQLAAFCRVEVLTAWPVNPDILARADLMVNCTSIGSELVHTANGKSFSLLAYSPLGHIGEIRPVPGGSDLHERFSRENQCSVIANMEETWEALLGVRHLAVYDVVYQPAQTILLALARARGLPCLGGEMMNLDQAVIAFIKAVGPLHENALEVATVRKLMTVS